MRKAFTFFLFISLALGRLFAQGEPSTYFNIYVPPNNDAVKRNVALIITAIFDETIISIVDDGADGDTDDTFSDTLHAGQSYIHYIADFGINDDALYASGGVLRQDGDYFIITANKNVYASQSTNSDWQHSWVPAVNAKAIGEKFILYSPKPTSSRRDINVFAYQDSTLVTIKRISRTPTLVTGLTDVDYNEAIVVAQRQISRGQDLIYFFQDGRNIMEDGHTYVVETNKPVAVQYGALFVNERDGGGNVPSANGSGSGDLFYFAVPYQAGGEQEIRIVSWDPANAVKLERFQNGNWIQMKTWTLGELRAGDWVGKQEGNVSYPTVFRVTCTPGKRVSVYEANWLETGSPGTSDVASMLTAESGATAGTRFLAYMAPPGNQQNVRNPFTGQLFGQRLTHLYLFARKDAVVTVKDAFTEGLKFSRTYTIQAGRYADCFLTEAEWRSIYNGTGATSGPERPYLIVESNTPISVMNTNFNDNWMMYFGTSQVQSLTQNAVTSDNLVIPGDTLTVTSRFQVQGQDNFTDAMAEVIVEGGLRAVNSVFVDSLANTQITGTITNNGPSQVIHFDDLPDLQPEKNYAIVTELVASPNDNSGDPVPGTGVSNVTTTVNGTVEGNSLQSVSSVGVQLNAQNHSQLLFSKPANTVFQNLLTDSWTASVIDYNRDGWEDLFVGDRSLNRPNLLYRNTGNGQFERVSSGAIFTDKGSTIASSWADIDNDGDLDGLVANNTRMPNFFYQTDENGQLRRVNTQDFTQEAGYYHNSSWVDYDNDGLLDLFLCNYWPTRFNELWRNAGQGNFQKQPENIFSIPVSNSIGASWADYDNDGYLDLFIPNNDRGENLLFHNEGGARFELVDNVISQEGGFSVGSCWGDINGDGLLDLFVANASGENNFLYLNNGNGSFSKVNSGPAVSDGGHSHGCSFADVDNDGDLDLYVTNNQGPKFLYLNDGNGNFSRRLDEVVVGSFGKSLGHVWLDHDKDGDLDLFVATHDEQPNCFFTNNGNGKNWINIGLQGSVSNRSAIGARVRIKANGRWQTREVNSQSGFGGQSSLRLHFGLGMAGSIDSLLIFWPSGYRQVLSGIGANQFLNIVEETGGILRGRLFADYNNNCILDANESYIPNQRLVVQPGNIQTFSDQEGHFQLHLPLGQWLVRFPETTKYRSVCQQTQTANLNSAGQEADFGNWGLSPVCQCTDVKIVASNTAFRRGFAGTTLVDVSNEAYLGTQTLQVRITAPSGLVFRTATPAWTQAEFLGDSVAYTWNIGRMKAHELRQISITDSVTLDFQVGDSIRLNCQVLGNLASDLRADDHRYILRGEVVGAIDPNDLLAFPKGFGRRHLIDRNQELTYKIRFENVGNYEAAQVILRDTLPSALDLESLGQLEASHKPFFLQLSGHILEVTFPNIGLPAREIDSIGSQGYFQFRIKPKSEVLPGEVISNRAHIQFDYSESIMTNTVFHTVKGNEQRGAFFQLDISPNPAHEEIALSLPAGRLQENRFPRIRLLTIVDSTGRILQQLSPDEEVVELNVSGYEDGLYLIKAVDQDGRFYAGKLLVRHPRQ